MQSGTATHRRAQSRGDPSRIDLRALRDGGQVVPRGRVVGRVRSLDRHSESDRARQDGRLGHQARAGRHGRGRASRAWRRHRSVGHRSLSTITLTGPMPPTHANPDSQVMADTAEAPPSQFGASRLCSGGGHLRWRQTAPPAVSDVGDQRRHRPLLLAGRGARCWKARHWRSAKPPCCASGRGISFWDLRFVVGLLMVWHTGTAIVTGPSAAVVEWSGKTIARHL